MTEATRGGPVGAELPLSGPGVVRERGYNVDYLLVAATGRIVPGFLLRRYQATEQDRLGCLAVGRRIWLPIEREAAAMRFALAYWYLMRLVFVVLWVLPLVVLGVVDRTLLGGGIRIVLAVVFGALFFSAVEFFFVYFRRLGLCDTHESWVDGDGLRHHVRLRTTKPYDAVVAIGTGLLATAMMLSQT